MTEIVLYANEVSNYCAKVRVVLEYKKVAYTAVPPPDGYGSAAHKKLVPQGIIPTVRHQGRVHREGQSLGERLL